jgi:hypothetical protein
MHTISISRPLLPEDGAFRSLPGTIGVEHDEWHAEARRLGPMVMISMTARNPRRALEQLAASDAPMDCWFKDGVRSLTGDDIPALFS